MCTPFWSGSRSTKQSISAETSASLPPCCMRTAFWTPVTPTRESPSRTSGTEAWRSGCRGYSLAPPGNRSTLRHERRRAIRRARLGRLPRPADAAGDGARLRADARAGRRSSEPADRYVEMIERRVVADRRAARPARLATRIQLGRYEPVLVETDSLELARRRPPSGSRRAGSSYRVRDRRCSSTRTHGARARSARARGRPGSAATTRSRCRWPARCSTIAPLSRPAEPVVLGEELRELAAPAAAMLVRALEGTLEARDETLVIRLPSGS